MQKLTPAELRLFANQSGFTVTICHWNIEGFKNSITSKFSDREFINELRKHDIVALTETHAGPNVDLTVDGYFTYCTSRAKHPKARKFSGGIAVLIRDHLRGGIEILRTSSDLVWVKLNRDFFRFQEDVYIGVAYISPQSSKCTKDLAEKAWNDLEKDVSQYVELGKVMLLGDFNSRTGTLADHIMQDDNTYTPTGDTYVSDTNIRARCSEDASTNEYGKKLLEVCKNARLRILNGRILGDLNGKMTCFQWNGSSVVDYCIVHEDLLGVIDYFKVHDLKGMFSNHCKISIQIPSDVKIVKNREKLSAFPSSIKWSEDVASTFTSLLESDEIKNNLSMLESSIATSDINETVENLTGIFQLALPNSGRKITKRTKRKHKHKKWFDTDCRDLKRSVNRANRLLIRTPWDVNARESFFRQRKQYKKLMKYKEKHYKSQIIDKLNTLNSKCTNEYWDIVDELKDLNSSTEKKCPASMVSSDKWHNHFKTLLYKSETSHELAESLRIRQLTEELESNENHLTHSLNNEISTAEIKAAIRLLKNKKACGLDMIRNEMLKASMSSCIPVIHKLFNKILNEGTFPDTWNKGYIVPLHKSGDGHDPNNYRGLTINSSLSKVFTTVLNTRLQHFLHKSDTINRHQIGFSKKSQTIDHMLVLKTLADKYKSADEKLYFGFVDFKKAYDTVWREGLIYKLLLQKVNGKLLNVIKSMYQTSECCVKVDNCITEFFKNNIGVKQGEVLSPLLFNLYINDLPEYVKDCESPTLNGSVIDCLLYADDLVLISTTKTGLQRKFDKLNKYCNEWRMSVNTDKNQSNANIKCR